MFQRIEQAKAYLEGRIIRTPMLNASGLANAKNIYLKAENLQLTGSFKIRGALYRISKLTQEEKNRGVIACSAGNHAQGVAVAARENDIDCVICMPESAPISKIQRTESYGAKVILVPGVFDDALVKARELEAEKGYVFIHPFDDLDIIAGQGTLGFEIFAQIPAVDYILVPVGGGGLLAGISAAMRHLNPSCKVIGVEPVGAASMKASIDTNAICTLETVRTIADGVAVRSPGKETFSLCQQHADSFVTVNESQITLAMLKLLEDHKVLVEGAGAASVAAAMYGKVDLRDKNVVCVVSGGNVDVNMVERIITKGLKQTGRVLAFATTLEDKPRQLNTLLDVLGDRGANILSVHHDRSDLGVNMDQCVVHVVFEARGPQHQRDILNRLQDLGYEIEEE